MIEVVTDLLGEVVEVRELRDVRDTYHVGNVSPRWRGFVRAIYVVNDGPSVLIEHDPSGDYGEKARSGGLAAYALEEHHVRVVKRCERCGAWDQKALICHGAVRTWEHKDGEGCKKVRYEDLENGIK